MTGVGFPMHRSMATGNRSLFISSCTRRELARRRATRTWLRIQASVAVVVLLVALGVFVAARGGL
jgi:hypothetical protein